MQPWTVPANEWKGRAVFILGGGPSLKGFDPARIRGRGKVIAVNNAGLDMMPDADVLFWADARWLDWNHADLHKHVGRYKITRKRPHIKTGFDIKFLRFIHPSGRMAHDQSSLGGWCGGSSAIELARLFGARVVFLLGFDMRPGNWHDRHLLPPLPNQHREKFIPTMETLAPQWLQAGMKIFNCNERSALRCFPFVQLDEVLQMDDLAKIEREKYLQVWEHDAYRKISPGMLEWERAWQVCGMQPGQSLIDFGSGPCRATLAFQNAGLNVLAIDHVPNARETDVPFVEACLWDLPLTVSAADWGFCCDVMEHIPPQRVADVLRSIAENVTRGCYFRIATRPDMFGPKILGQPLHLTVSAGEWWRRQVEQHFELVDVVQHTSRDIMLLARH